MASNQPVVIPITGDISGLLSQIQAAQQALANLTASGNLGAIGGGGSIPVASAASPVPSGGIVSPSGSAGGTSNMGAYAPPAVPSAPSIPRGFTPFTDSSGQPVTQDGMIVGQDARGNFATVPATSPAMGGSGSPPPSAPAAGTSNMGGAGAPGGDGGVGGTGGDAIIPGATPSAGRSGGMVGRIGTALAIREGVRAFEDTNSILLQNATTGSAGHWYDFLPAVTTAAGAGIGFFAGGGLFGSALGGMVGQAGGDAARDWLKLGTDKANVASLFNMLGPGRFSGYGLGPRKDIFSLAAGLGAEGVATGQYEANTFAQRAYGRDTTADHVAANAAIQGIAKGLDPETARLLNAPYSASVESAIMGKDFAAGVAYDYVNGVDPSRAAGRIGDTFLAGQRVSLSQTYADQAESRVGGISARGGGASQIASAIGSEQSALEGVAQKQREYIASLEAQGTALTSQKVKLEEARSELEKTNTAIDTLGMKARQLLSNDAMDVAGTASSIAGSGLQQSMMTFGRGYSASDMIGPSLDAQAGLLETLQAERARPGMDPAFYREKDRQIAEAKAGMTSIMRQGADLATGTQSRLASLDAQYSEGYAALNSAGSQNPLAIAAMSGRVADATGRAAATAYADYQNKAASGVFNAEELPALRNRALSLYGAAREEAMQAGRLPVTESMRADSSEYRVGYAASVYEGGSAAGLGAMQSRLGQIGTLEDDQRRVTAEMSRKYPALAGYYAAQSRSFLAGTAGERLSIEQGAGSYIASSELADRLDAARFGYERLQTDTFAPGNRRAALGSYIGVLDEEISGAQGEAAGLTGPARLQRQAQIRQMQLQEASLRRESQVGWEGRLMEGSFSAPSYAGTYATSNADALAYGHENPIFGARSAAGAAANRGNVSMPASDAARTGDAFAQGMASGTLNINLKIDGSTVQAIQMKANTVRDVVVDTGNATRSARGGL